MSKLSDLIAQVEKTDAELAKELRKEVKELSKRRPFGLNFERHQPENVRLYGRKARKGDKVNILPERGQTEKAENKEMWSVVDVANGNAKLEIAQDEEVLTTEASVEDLVVLSEFNEPIFPGLRETGRVERGGEKPYQVVINSENYHALEMLLYAYEGKVDCIYIDPPYNTGARDWKYNNDYVDDSDTYRHSKWLAMMERRLKAAKRLLNPIDSVLVVTIDEKEYLRLGLLLEQIFPSNTIQMISSVIKPTGNRRDAEFSRCDEYIYFVFIGSARVVSNGSTMREEISKEKKNVRWKSTKRSPGNNGRRIDRPNLFYPLRFDKNGKFLGVGDPLPLGATAADEIANDKEILVWPINSDGEECTWELSADTFINNFQKGYIRFGEWNGKRRAPYHMTKGMIKDFEEGKLIEIGRDGDGALILEFGEETSVRPHTLWTMKSHSASEYGTGLLKSFLPNRKFPFPKSLYAVEDTIDFFIANKPNALVLDFFAGSGTTAHAVMRLNHRDGGQRRSLSITNNEVGVEETKKLICRQLRQGDPEWEAFGICEYITKPRITAAINGETPDGEPIKGDYKFVDEFPMADGFEENAIFYDLTYEDEMMVELDMAFEKVAPILWLKAGQEGRCIDKRKQDYDIADTYAVLFDYRYSQKFMDALQTADMEKLRIAYIVTDQDSRFQDVAQQLPQGIEPVRLYESYLRTFKINQSEG